LWHCGQLTRRLRAAQSGALASLGVRSHAELRSRFSESSVKWSWMIDGKLAGMCGVTGSHLSFTGFIWLALAEAATRHPALTARAARSQIAEIMLTRREIYSVMFHSDAASMRWIEFLKFDKAEHQPDWIPDRAILMVHRKARA
jgi:hypothetical protein